MTALINHRIRENNGELGQSNRGWLFTMLLNHCDGSLQCYPSDPTLSNEVGVSRPTIQSAREWLIERGAIVRIPYSKWRESKKDIHHKKIMYQITGVIFIKNNPSKEDSTYKVIPTLYFPNQEQVDSLMDELEYIGFFSKLSLQKESLQKVVLQKLTLHEVVTVFKVDTEKEVNTEKPLSPKVDSVSSIEQSEADLTKEHNKAINELIKAWIDSLPSKPLDETNPYKKKGYRDHASNMVDAGITAQDIERFVKAVTAQGQFFADKKLPFGKVTSDIAAWLQEHPSENKPDKPLDYAAIGLTPPEQQAELTIEEFERRQDEMQALKDKLTQAWGVNRDRKISRMVKHA